MRPTGAISPAALRWQPVELWAGRPLVDGACYLLSAVNRGTWLIYQRVGSRQWWEHCVRGTDLTWEGIDAIKQSPFTGLPWRDGRNSFDIYIPMRDAWSVAVVHSCQQREEA